MIERASSATRSPGQLSSVPHGDDPDYSALNAIEETVGRHDDLAMGEVRELRDRATGPWESFQVP
jgi:hypothetical protein